MNNDTIVALATAQGVSAIAVIRLSGNDAIDIADKVFKGKKLADQSSHTIHFGTLHDGDKMIDEVLVSIFRAPHSFTKENSVEISCHGSPVIVKEIIKALLKHGATVTASDPVAIPNAKKLLGEKVPFFEDPYAAIDGADALLVVTEWNEFRRPDFERIKKALRTPVLLDGRNVYDPAHMKELGFEYRGIGRR